MKNRSQASKAKKAPPSPGPLKQDPKELEKILDQAIKDSMATSDAIATVMPEVKKDTGRQKP